MSELDNHKRIQELARKIEVSPSSHAWDKISDRLNQDKKIKTSILKSKVRYWLSVAASVMIIITCVSVIYFESNQPPRSYQSGKVIGMQTLESSTDYFYSVENARRSVNTYLKLK